ncbi:hypothetical protein, partial [Jannaschia seohaensis]
MTIITNDLLIKTIVDETFGLQNIFTGDSSGNDIDWDDPANSAIASYFSFLSDSLLPSSTLLTDVALSGYNGENTGENVVDVDASAVGTVSDLELVITGGGEGSDSGLTSGDTSIYLYTLTLSSGEKIIVGRLGTEGGESPDSPNPTGDIVFAVSLVEQKNSEGEIIGAKLVVAQYNYSLDNPFPGDGSGGTYDELTNDLAGKIGVAVEQELSFESDGVPPSAQLFVMFLDEQNGNNGIIVTGKNPADESALDTTWNTYDTVNTSAADQTVGDKLIKTTIGSNAQMIKSGDGVWYSLASGIDPNFAVPLATSGTNREESNIRYTETYSAEEVDITLTQLQSGNTAQLLITGINSLNFDDEANNAVDASDYVNDLHDDLADLEHGRTQVVDVVGVRVYGEIPGKGKNPGTPVDVTFTQAELLAGASKEGISVSIQDGSVLVEGLIAGFTVQTTFDSDVNRVLYENGAPLDKTPGAKDEAEFDLGGFRILDTNTETVDVGYSVAFSDDGPSVSVAADGAEPGAVYLFDGDLANGNFQGTDTDADGVPDADEARDGLPSPNAATVDFTGTFSTATATGADGGASATTWSLLLGAATGSAVQFSGDTLTSG